MIADMRPEKAEPRCGLEKGQQTGNGRLFQCFRAEEGRTFWRRNGEVGEKAARLSPLLLCL